MWCVAEAGRELLRVDLSLLSKRGEPEEDPRLLLKSLPARPGTAPPPLRDVSRVSKAHQSIIYPPHPLLKSLPARAGTGSSNSN